MVAEWERLLDEAVGAFEQGHHHDALQFCDRAAMMGEPARYHAAMLRGDILLDLGDPAGALSSYETVADPDEADATLDCARGVALFEMGRLAEAENALMSAVRQDAELAEGWYTLGLVSEMLGTGQQTECFRRARRLDPEHYPHRSPVALDDFERAVNDAIGGLRPGLRQALQCIPVLIADFPHPEDLRCMDPPLSPLALGVFVGTPPSLSANMIDLPDTEQPKMVLFKRNLERCVGDGTLLVDEIRRTITEELGLALGLSESELAEPLGEPPYPKGSAR